MNGMISLLRSYDGELVVLDTDDATLLGTLRVLSATEVTVRTGLTGRPPIINVDDVDDVTRALAHPAVEVL